MTIQEQLETMSDVALVKSLTVDKESYTDSFITHAREELKRRGVEIPKLLDRLNLRFGEVTLKEVSIAQALDKIKADIADWNTWELTNLLDQSLVIQKEPALWGIHLFDETGYNCSYNVKTTKALSDFVRAFFLDEEWDDTGAYQYQLQDWSIIAASDSMDYVMFITGLLDERDIHYSLKLADTLRFHAYFGAYKEKGRYKILVPNDQLEAAQSVLDTIENKIRRLYDRANLFGENSTPAEELEVYDQLAKLVTDDENVFFNRGIVLYRLEKYDAAAASFMDAAAIADSKQNEEMIGECRNQLHQILSKRPDSLPTLQALGFVATRQNDFETAAGYYRKILERDPENKVIHLNLGLLYYEGDYADEKVRHHLKKYLELDPDAEDREDIEAILTNL